MDDPVTCFGNAIRAAGLDLEGDPVMDGTRQRIAVVDGKRGNKNGSYIGYLDGRPAGSIENFTAGTRQAWKYEGAQVEPLTLEQKSAIEARRQQRADALAARHAAQALICEQRWERATVMAGAATTPYLTRKQVPAIGVRRDGKNTLVPMRDIDGKLWSIQTIFPEKRALVQDGVPIDKVMAKNARKEGNFHLLGEIRPGAPILVAEGYATAASAHLATGHAVVVAFDSGNLDAVAGALRARHLDNPMLVLGDDDRHKERNVGRNKATEAACKHGAGVTFPQFSQEGPGTDFNDLHVTEGLIAVKEQIEHSLNAGIFKGNIMSEKRDETAEGAGRAIDIPAPVGREQVAESDETVPAAPAPKKPRKARAPKAGAAIPAAMTRAERQAALEEAKLQHKQRIDELLAGVKPLSDQEMAEKYRLQRAAEAAAMQATILQPAQAAPVDTPAAQVVQAVVPPVENSIEQGPSRTVEPEPAPLPRHTVGADANAWLNQNAQQWRDLADVRGLTPMIEKLLSEGQTAGEVTATMKEQLANLPLEDRANFIIAVRATLGIPSRMAEESRAEFDAWKASYDARMAQTPGIGPIALAIDAQRKANIQAAIIEASSRDTEDARHLRAIIASNAQLAQRTRGTMLQDEACEYAKRDIAAIRSIKSTDTRTLALLVINDNQVAQMAYRQELSRRAPEVTLAANSAHAGQQNKDGVQAVTDFGSRAPAQAPFIDRSKAVPESVKARFIVVDHDYFFPDKTPAFIDRDSKLATRGENVEVIRSMVQIAKARDWQSITVKGTEEFRRSAWLEASLVGINVEGYKPTALDKEDLARRPSGNSVARAAEHVQVAPPELTLVKAPEPAVARASMDPALQAKAAAFIKEKPSFVVKKHPDLAPVYGTLAAAELFAAKHLPGHEAQFLAIAKEFIAAKIVSGEKVPAPLLHAVLDKQGPKLGKSEPKKDVGQQMER